MRTQTHFTRCITARISPIFPNIHTNILPAIFQACGSPCARYEASISHRIRLVLIYRETQMFRLLPFYHISIPSLPSRLLPYLRWSDTLPYPYYVWLLCTFLLTIQAFIFRISLDLFLSPLFENTLFLFVVHCCRSSLLLLINTAYVYFL